MTELCQVVFTGTLDGDADIENAVEQFSNLLDYSIDESRSLLTAGREVVIKQGVDPDRAEYCQRALTQVGVGVRIESADSETTDSPFTESANDTGNPYQVSSASFYEAEGQGELTDPHSVPVLRGWFWIQEGFGYIRRRGAWSWLLAAMIYLSIIFGGSFVPLIGPYAVILILPVLNAGFMLGCREQDEGGRFSVKHLLGGFQKPRNQLLLVGGVYIVGVVVSAGVEMALWTLFLLEIDLEAAEMPVWLVSLVVGQVLMIPLSMTLWFAPALVALEDFSAVTAMKMSFVGCIRNVLPFLLYAVVNVILLILSVTSLGLGALVAIPIMLSSTYVAYRDIYYT